MAATESDTVHVLMEKRYPSKDTLPNTLPPDLEGKPSGYFLSRKEALLDIQSMEGDINYEKTIGHDSDGKAIAVTQWDDLNNEGLAWWIIFDVQGLSN